MHAFGRCWYAPLPPTAPVSGQARRSTRRPAARAAPAARSVRRTRCTRAARLAGYHRAPRARLAGSSMRPCRSSCRLPAAHAGPLGGRQRARHARAARQPPAHPPPARARCGLQVIACARALRQRAVRARVAHPAGGAAVATAAAACPGACSTAHPARAPRQMRTMDEPHARDACPARALAQTGRFGALPVGLGFSRRRLLASSSRHPNSTPHVTPRAPDVPHGHVGCRDRGEGERRP